MQPKISKKTSKFFSHAAHLYWRLEKKMKNQKKQKDKPVVVARIVPSSSFRFAKQQQEADTWNKMGRIFKKLAREEYYCQEFAGTRKQTRKPEERKQENIDHRHPENRLSQNAKKQKWKKPKITIQETKRFPKFWLSLKLQYRWVDKVFADTNWIRTQQRCLLDRQMPIKMLESLIFLYLVCNSKQAMIPVLPAWLVWYSS